MIVTAYLWFCPEEMFQLLGSETPRLRDNKESDKYGQGTYDAADQEWATDIQGSIFCILLK